MSSADTSFGSDFPDASFPMRGRVDQSYRASWIETIDYIPIVSTISGAVRGAFGILETVFGLATLIPHACLRMTGHAVRPYFLVSGISNIVRGSVAGCPIARNIALYFYDHMVHIKTDFRRTVGIEIS